MLSLATLLLELSFTRILSVVLWYHFGFFVIATALLAFGVAGVALSVSSRLRQHLSLDRTLAWLSVAFGAASLASTQALRWIPFDPLRLLSDPRQLVLMPVCYVVLATPFLCSGLAIALLLTRGARVVNRLYATDLAGAGAGCAAVALTMPILGGSGSALAAAALGLLAAAVFGHAQARAVAIGAVGLALGVFTFAAVADRVLPIGASPHKQHPLAETGREPVYSAWNTFSRIDVYELPSRPSEGWPTPGLGIVIDAGSAGTGIGDLSAGVEAFFATVPAYRPPGIAYVGKVGPRVLVIGSGAGREVLEALYFGASSVTAVEVNPIITELAARRMRDRWGDLFARPEVTLVTDEGRSFVRRSRDEYDAILAVQAITNAAIASGALSLAESYVFTREAIDDYLDHLSDDGVLLVTGPLTQLVRLFATMREVFAARGLGNPSRHLVAFRAALSPYGPRHDHTGLLFKKSPFTGAELGALAQRLEGNTIHEHPEILYSPLDPAPGSLFDSVLRAPDLRQFYATQPLQLAPSTDDWPFFHSQTRWSAVGVRALLQTFARDGARRSDQPPVDVVTLAVLLIQSTGIAAIFIIAPLARFARSGLGVSRCWRYLSYFAGVGLGFIVVEIVLLQRFTLFLGQPVYTLAVTLATLLAFTGIGSYLADRVTRPSPRRLVWVAGGIVAVLALATIVIPRTLATAISLALPWRLLITVALVGPIGVVLGMPLPLGLRVVADKSPMLVPWAWGVNGFFTVIGSVIAMIVAITSGLTIALAFAAACYVLAAAGIGSSRSE